MQKWRRRQRNHILSATIASVESQLAELFQVVRGPSHLGPMEGAPAVAHYDQFADKIAHIHFDLDSGVNQQNLDIQRCQSYAVL